MKRTARVLIALLGLAVVAVGAFVVWYFFIDDDAPPKAALPDRPTVTTTTGDDVTATTAPAPELDGTWTVQTGDEVFAGYRIQELFASETVKKDAVGRTPAVDGEITISGAAVESGSFTADLTQLASDQDRRDNALRGRGLQTDQFPTATFALTEPVDFGAAPAVGDERTVTAVGDLTLHGVTKSVTVEMQTRWNGDSIDVAGGAPIALADYGIEPPDVAGFLEVDDAGEFEFQLTFVRTAA